MKNFVSDNMLVEFDMNDLEKSFKYREDKDFDESHALDQVMNNDIKTI